ncbi:putative plant snare 12, partial [Quercus suber]
SGYMYAAMTNRQLIDSGNRMMDKTDQAIGDTINVGTETAAALKKVATDRCIMALLFLIIAVGVIAIIIVKLVNPDNKDIRDIPGLAPPTMGWKLVWSAS